MQIDAVSRRPQSAAPSVLASSGEVAAHIGRGEGGLHHEHRGTRFTCRKPGRANDRDDAHRRVERHRHGGRVVRFPDLRHGKRARLQQAVLSIVRSGAGHHSCFRHLRRRLPGPPLGRRDLRTFWRPGRSQGHARDDDHHHGAWYLPDRPPAHLRPDRHRSASSARPPASASGHRPRRRMGRSRAHGRRECAGQEPRASRLDGSDRLSDRESRRNRHVRAAVAGA